MKTLNLKLVRLVQNLWCYALVYGMDGICEICDQTIGCNAILFENISSLRWACSSVRRRLVVDLKKDQFDRVFKFGKEQMYEGMVSMTELEIELDLI